MNWRDRKAELRETFQEAGYVVIPQFLKSKEVQEVRQNLNRFIHEVAPTLPREEVYYEDRGDHSTIKQIPRLQVHDEYFHQWHDQGRCRDLAEVLLDGPVLPWTMQYFNKPPGIGEPTPAHQDGYYFKLTPCEGVTMWLALEDVDEENGCIRYIQGSNRRGMRPHGSTDTLGFSQGITDYCDTDTANEVVLPAGPGDLIVHHALTIHRADGNRSAKRTRQALGFIYFAEHAKEDVEAQQAYQDRLAQERIKAGKL